MDATTRVAVQAVTLEHTVALTARMIIDAALAQGVSLEELRAELGATEPAETLDDGSMAPDALDDWALPGGDGRVIAGLSRYEDRGLLGIGGMGEVRRVWDRRLGRTLALKILRADVGAEPALRERFVREARATAQLAHPGVVPVYDLGQLPDGRLWFAMQEVTGRTYGQVISAVHQASPDCWRVTRDGWSLRRLVEGLRRVCDAVAYAHSRGVVHRDLKPDNIMVGAFDEVLVLDWGLARVGEQGEEDALPGTESILTGDSGLAGHQTRAGQVAGTPVYMSPEQARAEHDRVSTRSDVYSLGAILYEVLSGRPPYSGTTSREVLAQVRSHPPKPLSRSHAPSLTFGFSMMRPEEPEPEPEPEGRVLPPALMEICETAMARDPAERWAGAAELAAELRAWLDGDKRAEEARVVVTEAAAKGPQAATLRILASGLRAEAERLLADVEPWQPESAKATAWAKLDQATELEQQAQLTELEQEQLLQGSLTHAPSLPEAHAALAARYRTQHEAAEHARRNSTRAEGLLRQHAMALPPDHPARVEHLTYLAGDGALTLHTAPSGASVSLYRYTIENRRLVPQLVGELGQTPLDTVPLPRGSYVCRVQHPDCEPVRYPVCIGRGEHWHGVPPGGVRPAPVHLPRRGSLGPRDCYIPAGWFASGGDSEARDSLPGRRLWAPGWVFRRDPVTNREYLDFLHALVAAGQVEEALRHAPRERGAAPGELGALLCAFDGTRFSLPRLHEEGEERWDPDWPVIMVDWDGARAYAAHLAASTGLPWQLPDELVWEKAARGVDARAFPWGDAFDPSWACMKDSHSAIPTPKAVDAFLIDESVYGVRGLCGNVKDWCLDAWQIEGPVITDGQVPAAPAIEPGEHGRRAGLRVRKGGGWDSVQSTLRAAARDARNADHRAFDMGFRVARLVGFDRGS